MADAPGDGDAGTVEAAFSALRGTENPANVFALGGLLAQEQPHVRPSRFPLFMELLESRMPSATWGSSKQAACGGDRFHGMEWLVRGWRVAAGVRTGSRDMRERVKVGGRWWSYPLGIARERMEGGEDVRPPSMPVHFLRLDSFGAAGSCAAWGLGSASCGFGLRVTDSMRYGRMP